MEPKGTSLAYALADAVPASDKTARSLVHTITHLRLAQLVRD